MWFLFLPEVFVGLWPLWASADDGGRGWGSYCGSGAAEQLDEFMVGSSSRCQAWFPPGAKHRPYGQPEVEEGQLPRYLKDLRDALSCFSCLYFLFTVINHFFGEGIYLQDGKRGINRDQEIWVWTNECQLAIGFSMTWNISKMITIFFIICPTTEYWILEWKTNTPH